jgi:hypothetical protein
MHHIAGAVVFTFLFDLNNLACCVSNAVFYPFLPYPLNNAHK